METPPPYLHLPVLSKGIAFGICAYLDWGAFEGGGDSEEQAADDCGHAGAPGGVQPQRRAADSPDAHPGAG